MLIYNMRQDYDGSYLWSGTVEYVKPPRVYGIHMRPEYGGFFKSITHAIKRAHRYATKKIKKGWHYVKKHPAVIAAALAVTGIGLAAAGALTAVGSSGIIGSITSGAAHIGGAVATGVSHIGGAIAAGASHLASTSLVTTVGTQLYKRQQEKKAQKAFEKEQEEYEREQEKALALQNASYMENVSQSGFNQTYSMLPSPQNTVTSITARTAGNLRSSISPISSGFARQPVGTTSMLPRLVSTGYRMATTLGASKGQYPYNAMTLQSAVNSNPYSNIPFIPQKYRTSTYSSQTPSLKNISQVRIPSYQTPNRFLPSPVSQAPQLPQRVSLINPKYIKYGAIAVGGIAAIVVLKSIVSK